MAIRKEYELGLDDVQTTDLRSAGLKISSFVDFQPSHP